MSRAREFADLAGSADAGGLTGRNLVINGAMQCWQRATAATAAANSYSTVDRFRMNQSNDGAYTTEQSTDTPTGTGFSLKAQVTTADTSIGAAQYAYIHQNIEAQNLQQLQYGTSDAKNITLSFQVKSNKTGTYTIVVRKLDTTAYHFVHEYTINSANTWEKKEITISPTAGSTSLITASGGAIANDNGKGIQIGWNLAFGSDYTGATNNTWSSNTNHYATSNQVNWMDSTSNNFYLTQVQFEVGDKATPFEHRSFADELQRCQRYYAVRENTTGSLKYYGILQAYGTSAVYGLIADYPVTMRTTPTVSQSGTFGAYTASSGDNSMATTIGNLFASSHAWGTSGWSGTSNLVAGYASVMYAGTNAKLMADAEL